jgi:hypothetical protein
MHGSANSRRSHDDPLHINDEVLVSCAMYQMQGREVEHAAAPGSEPVGIGFTAVT